MKYKKTLIASILIILSVTTPYLYLSQASGTSVAALSFDPSSISDSSLTPGNKFTIDLQVSNIQNMWNWGVDLAWDPAVLSWNSTKEGPFLKSGGATFFGAVPTDVDKPGVLEGTGDVLTSLSSVNGSGVLASFTFLVLKTGTSTINITYAECDEPSMDYTADPVKVPLTSSNFTFTNLVTTTSTPTPTSTQPLTAYGPTADFTPLDGTSFKLGTIVQLNGLSSLPGYDTVNQSETCPIVSYFWGVEFLNGTAFSSLSGPTVSFNASVEGSFRITLIVTASDPHPPSNSNFQTLDTATAIINVLSNPQDSKIDVFTDRGGNGAAINSSAYGPLEIVHLYALVTYHNSLMLNQNVVFTVHNARSSTVAVIEGVTNESGIATAMFRMPDSGTVGTSLGAWSVTAAVNVTNVAVNDTASFSFMYLSGIQDIQIPASVHKLDSLPIELTINTANCPASWSTLSISLFDETGIPIGSCTTTAPKQPQNFTIINSAITIPSWAFNGNATAYFCLLTNSSSGSIQIPLAPENSTTFQILP